MKFEIDDGRIRKFAEPMVCIVGAALMAWGIEQVNDYRVSAIAFAVVLLVIYKYPPKEPQAVTLPLRDAIPTRRVLERGESPSV